VGTSPIRGHSLRSSPRIREKGESGARSSAEGKRSFLYKNAAGVIASPKKDNLSAPTGSLNPFEKGRFIVAVIARLA